MRQILLGFLLTCCVSLSIAQAPAVVKTVLGTITEPNAKDQEGWKNNEWNGLFFYEGKGSPAKLCVTDGTNAGTQFLVEIGPGNLVATIPAQDFMYIITNRYASFSPLTLEAQIWKSDGTAAGTSLVFSMPQTSIANSNIWTSDIDSKRNFSVIGNTMFFGGYDAVNGSEIWRTNGTTAGTYMVKDIKAGTGNSSPMAFAKIGTDVFFSCMQTGLERKLWKTDGTTAGTVQIDVPEPFFIADNAVGLVNNKMVFFAHNTVDGYEPYVSDGTAAGTFMLRNINAAGNSSIAQTQNAHLRFNSRHCFFIANNGTANALWTTDGTTAGTLQLTSNAQAAWSGVSGGSYTDVNETGLWMIDYNGGGSSEKLYYSDGTVAGTYQVANGLSYAQNIKIYQSGLWMAARNTASIANVEVWRSGGNMATTNLAFDIANLSASSNPYGYFVKNGKLHFFAATSSPSGHNLYQYTGDFTFNGSQAGGRWRDSANWNGMMPPGIRDTVFVNSGTPNALQINTATAYAGTLMLGNNASLNLSNPTDTLVVNSSIIAGSSNNTTGNGILSLRNVVNDTVAINGSFSAAQLAIQSTSTLVSGNLTVSGNFHLANNNQLLLNNNLLTMSGSTSTISRTGTGYINTNGTGRLLIENIGSSGRTGAVGFPIGTAGNYNPVYINNSGATDQFSARVEPQLFMNYSGETGIGGAYTTAVVNSNWFITEAVAGGSNAAISLQWNAAQELPGFSRTTSKFGHYSAGSWQLGAATTAAGTDPYTLIGTGISSFSPFAVFNDNATLPLNFITFSVSKCNTSQACLKWQTSSERNVSHFNVERSVDAVTFTTIAQVRAQNQSFNHYTINDEPSSLQHTPGIYYRLHQIDADGRSAYSATRFIGFSADNSITVFPNPVTDILHITNWQLVKEVRLFDVSGKAVKTWFNGFSQLGMNELTPGVYLLKMALQNGATQQHSILKR